MVGDSNGTGDTEPPDTSGADNVELTDPSVAGSSKAPAVFRFMFGSCRELANIRLKNEMEERAVMIGGKERFGK